MRIRWTPPAAADLQHISDYLNAHNPHYHKRTMRKIWVKIQGLKQAPHTGRPGRIEGTRELLFLPMPYVVVYRVENDAIEVWRIWHTSQWRA